MLVAEVRSDRVRLTLGGDSEELVLKIAAGPKTTVNPAPPPSPVAGVPPFPQTAAPSAAQPEPAQLLEQRRRAARAATAAEGVPPVAPAPARGAMLPGSAPAAGQGAESSTDPAWNEVYERMRQRTQPAK
jgi:hypothetical protein